MSNLLPDTSRPALITGGVGFVGTNLAARLLDAHHPVIILDNFSGPSVEPNLRYLRERYGERVEIARGDVRDLDVVRAAVRGASYVFHLAAQAATTSSMLDPVLDFEVNARGTLNVLEALRSVHRPIPLVFASSSKVYGSLSDVALEEIGRRYVPMDVHLEEGIDEERPLEFESPHGCSKGAADQYVLGYARSFGLPATVLRVGTVYGPRQVGSEDQGWVTHLVRRASADAAIVVYGDGMQVRDLLFASDLVDALLDAATFMDEVTGLAFNIGGGAPNATSVLELLDRIGRLRGRRPQVRFDRSRRVAQRYYVSDTRKFRTITGWSPQVDIEEGMRRLVAWG